MKSDLVWNAPSPSALIHVLLSFSQKYLHDYWNDPSLSERDRFLRDFILNKMHLRHADDDDDDDDETKYSDRDLLHNLKKWLTSFTTLEFRRTMN